MKYSLTYGINHYKTPNNDLKGCVNDALIWSDILKNLYGFENRLLLNEDATFFAVYSIIEDMITNSKAGDVLVITGSSHGTHLPDKDCDEVDGQDEAICLYDNILTDDAFSKLISKLPDGVSLTVISDSCFSGTVTRDYDQSGTYKNPRYMPFNEYADITGLKNIFDILHLHPNTNEDNQPDKPVPVPVNDQQGMKEVLISGCSNKQYSYDAEINGTYHGAFSFYAQQIIRNNPNLTYQQFYQALSKKLPNDSYPQSPQLEGKVSNLEKPLFT